MRVFIMPLGCSKNDVESERLAAAVLSSGDILADSPNGADIAIVNTCAFIQPAVEESIDVILDLELLQERKELGKIVIAGCLPRRYGDELKKEIPDAIYFNSKSPAEDYFLFRGKTGCVARRSLLPKKDGAHRYLKIGDGCDNQCSYCTIPMIRGPLQSRPIDELSEEVAMLASQGAKEICLVAQDITSYGRDIGYSRGLVGLLDSILGASPEDVMFRLLYLSPWGVSGELIDKIISEPRIANYLDIPVQHVSKRILSAMNRFKEPCGALEMKRLFYLIRDRHPDFAFRTTFMLGFPGETDEDYEELLGFMESVEFDRAGAFVFSREKGAGVLEDDVSDEVKQERLEGVMTLQQEISWKRNKSFEGRVLKVLVEEVNREDGVAWGRSYREAPEVDGEIEIQGVDELESGVYVDVVIKEAFEHDMLAIRN